MSYRLYTCLFYCLLINLTANAQQRRERQRPSFLRPKRVFTPDHPRYVQPNTRQPSIYFPQAPQPGKVRKSIGIVFTTTPPELTEEILISVPAIDGNIQYGLTKHLFLTGRVQSQIIQSNIGLGLRWGAKLTDRLYVSPGFEATTWFGALRIKDVFTSQAYGIQTYPSLSVGYRLTRDVQFTIKGEAIMDLYYRSQVGNLAVVYDNRQVNGVALTFMLEQPFYHNRHVSLGFRAAYSNFNWQFWSLFDTFDRNLFYPQLIFGFIL